MATLPIGCGQITWTMIPGAEPGQDEVALRDIGEIGYAGAPASVRPDETPAEMVARFARYGLKPAPGYFGGTYRPEVAPAVILDDARRAASAMREVGCTELYIAGGGWEWVTPRGKTRRQLAGQITAEDALPEAEFAQYAALIDQIGAVALEEGVKACFHNHVGTIVETRAEMENLLSQTDPAHVFLGPDTGHFAWAGDDPVAFCRDYATRIKTVHLKDCHANVIAQGKAAGWPYREFVEHGVFAELGQGNVDFPAILQILRDADFTGWLIAETDRTMLPTARESATISYAYLRSLGL
jgi:inosose dehydratase